MYDGVELCLGLLLLSDDDGGDEGVESDGDGNDRKLIRATHNW